MTNLSSPCHISKVEGYLQMNGQKGGQMSDDQHPDSSVSASTGQAAGEPPLATNEKDILSHPRKSRRRIIVGVVLFFIILIVGLAYFFRMDSPYRETDDAYVHGNQISLTSRVSGTVIAINADATDLVRMGQPLVLLDDSDAKVRLRQAEATLEDTMRKVCQFYISVRQIKASITARKIEVARTEADYRRRTSVAEGSVPVEEITHAREAVDAARAVLQVAKQQLASAQALVVATDLEDHPMVLQAAANVLNAYLALQRTIINAPATGYVARRNVQIGERVTPGTPLLTIIPLDQIWVDANFKEEQLKDVRIGQHVKLRSDFYGSSVEYRGYVAGLSPGTGAAFAILPPQEASGNWIKIVQRVPVRIHLDEKQLKKFPLRLGLSMQAVIDTADRSGPVLAKAPPEKPVYFTTIYSSEWAKATELLQGLLKTNLQALSSLAGQFSAKEVQVNAKGKTTDK
ncbi:MAG: HlyD family efflux transporter periplasmic adaptor subunit [Terriglobia bacterium]